MQIAQSIQRFEASTVVSVSRDKTDDKFIGLAIDSGATILISGDPDLKDVKAYKGVEILSLLNFLSVSRPDKASNGLLALLVRHH
ncbi:MAG: hypothetical protein NTY26_05830 [Burkholderiales bacterium]|nr:hypothetical protein [Burkholderiales bacterium]